ncbi:WXG100 family type VII secretion target [Wangella sp. NEAU-J3]|nr:WXG100 family type VII secretion target [Jidongwangia harbinensis]
MTETLERAASVAGNVAGSIDGHRASLRPTVEALRGQWEGTGRVAFEGAHQTWEEGINRLVAALRALGENTAYSVNTYVAADETNRANFEKVQNLGAFGGALRS